MKVTLGNETTESAKFLLDLAKSRPSLITVSRTPDDYLTSQDDEPHHHRFWRSIDDCLTDLGLSAFVKQYKS